MANKQKHYNPLKAHSLQEVFRVLEAWNLTANAYLWTATKYLARVTYSGKPIQDRVKSRWYIERDIQVEMAKVLNECANLAEAGGKPETALAFREAALAITRKHRPSTFLRAMLVTALCERPGQHEVTPKELEVMLAIVNEHPLLKWAELSKE